MDAVQIKHRNKFTGKIKYTAKSDNPSAIMSRCNNCSGTHPAKHEHYQAFGQQYHNCENSAETDSDKTFPLEGLSLHTDNERKFSAN